MPPLDPHRDSTNDHRIADLEACIGWLESVVAQLLGEPPARRAPVSLASGAAQSHLQTPLSMARTQPLSRVVASKPAETAQHQESMSTLLDNMGITAAFAGLDAKVEAASAEECMIAPIRLSDAPVLEIDPDLLGASARRPAADDIDCHAVLEDQHPSILQKITSTWRTPEARAYLHKLLVDDRSNRTGFDPAVMSELLLLSSLLEEPKPDAKRAPGAYTH